MVLVGDMFPRFDDTTQLFPPEHTSKETKSFVSPITRIQDQIRVHNNFTSPLELHHAEDSFLAHCTCPGAHYYSVSSSTSGNVCANCGKRPRPGKIHVSSTQPSLQEPRHTQALIEIAPHYRLIDDDIFVRPNAVLHFMRADTGKNIPKAHYQYATWHRENIKAASELAVLMTTLSHEVTLEEYAEIEAKVFRSIFKLVHHGETILHKMAGIAALDAVMDCPSAEEEKKTIKFANILSSSLRNGRGNFDFLSAVCKALGHMATQASNVDFVENEIMSSLERLRNGRSDRRLAACLLLTELAVHTPSTLHSKTSQTEYGLGGSNEFIDHLFDAVKDPQPIVRACAADALSQNLKILVQRGQTALTRILCQVYRNTLQGLQQDDSKQPWRIVKERIALQHGSLLTVSTLLAVTKSFMLPRFGEVCRAVLDFSMHEDILIRIEVIRLIPRLAARFPKIFARHFLEESLDILIYYADTLPKPREIDLRPVAFRAIGQVIVSMKDDSTGYVIGSSDLPVLQLTRSEVDGEMKYSIALNPEGLLVNRLDTIFNMLKTGLSSSTGKPVLNSVLMCASDLVSSLGKVPLLESLLEEMFKSGLSQDLIYSLQRISDRVPECKGLIEERMLQEVSLSLAGLRNVYSSSVVGESVAAGRLLKAANRRLRGASIAENSSLNISINRDTGDESVHALVLSLQTLASFAGNERAGGPTGTTLYMLPFLRDVVSRYLFHPSAQVRYAAALTCCSTLVPLSGDRSRTMGSNSGIVIEGTLKSLLQVSVSDPNPMVRLCIVQGLDARYDAFLIQSHHLNHLFLLLQDSLLATRAAGLRLLGRLADKNPAPILPFVRRYLKELLYELQCGTDNVRGMEESMHLLTIIFKARGLRRVVSFFISPLIDALPVDKHISPRLSSASLEAVGDLAYLSGDALRPWLDKIIPLVLGVMKDKSSTSKQQTSLRTLGQISSATGYVIKPYLDFPDLLSNATDILPATKHAPWALRREVIKTLGILGALDPDRYSSVAWKRRKTGATGGAYFDESVSLLQNQKSSNENTQRFVVPLNDDEDQPASLFMYEHYTMIVQPVESLSPRKRILPSDENFYATVVIQGLMRIFSDPALGVHHGMVIQAIAYIFKSLGRRSSIFLPIVMPQLLLILRDGPFNLRETLFKQLATLSDIVRDHLRNYVGDIFELVEIFWETRHMSSIFELLSNIASGMPQVFDKYLPRLVRLILSFLSKVQVSNWSREGGHGHLNQREQANRQRDEAQRMELILKGIGKLKSSLGDHIHILISPLLGLASSLASLTLNPGFITESDLTELSVLTFRTISILLENQSTETNPASISFFKGDGSNSRRPSESALAARVVQPVISIFEEHPPKLPIVGLSMIETLCICARLMGGESWSRLYDDTVRNTITSWQMSFPLRGENDGKSSSVHLDGRVVTCLEIYDETVEELLHPSSKRIRASSTDFWASGDATVLFSSPTRDSLNVGEAVFESHDYVGHPGLSAQRKERTEAVNQGNLQRAWDTSQVVSRDDWEEWMRRFAIQLLREAPDPSLRATSSLAQAYQPLARELFNAAFVCCWNELNAAYRQSLLGTLEKAFQSDISPEILQALLNLAEFMEHDPVGGLPINISKLAHLALTCRAYARALYYREREFAMEGASRSRVESLISINRKLDLQEAALGVLRFSTASLGESHGSQPGVDFVRRFGKQSLDLCYSVTWATEEKRRSSTSSEDLYKNEGFWLAKLGNWSEALEMYQSRLKEHPSDFEAMLGCLRCLNAGGNWSKVLDLAAQYSSSLFDHTSTASDRSRRKANRVCAEAAWRLGEWEEFDQYATQLSHTHQEAFSPEVSGNKETTNKMFSGDFDGSFFRAVSCIHHKNWDRAASAIDEARRAMDGRLTALMSESYKRAYPSMVTAQTLAEMEESIEFLKLQEASKNSPSNATWTTEEEVKKARERLQSLWNNRLTGCRVDSYVHSSIIRVRTLVLGPGEQVDSILKLSELSRQARRFKYAERVLLDPLYSLGADLNGAAFGFGFDVGPHLELSQIDDSVSPHPLLGSIVAGDLKPLYPDRDQPDRDLSRMIVRNAGGLENLKIQYRLYFAFVKHLWVTDRRDEALSRISHFCNAVDLISDCEGGSEDLSSLQVSSWLKMGEWKLSTAEASQSDERKMSVWIGVLYAFRRATLMENCGYKAHHNWALMNFRIAQEHVDQEIAGRLVENGTNRVRDIENSSREHIIAAVRSFAKAISVGTKKYLASVQQDLLNFLTCLFRYGGVPKVCDAIKDCVDSVATEAWLGVLPQLLARIQLKEPGIRSILHPLLIRLGEKHPQAMMYPLSVLEKSPVIERKLAAESLMNTLKDHSSGLVEEAQMVSAELIRVAIVWLETWHDGLEAASRYKYRDHDVAGMLDLLLPMHDTLEEGAETKYERDFISNHGNDLKLARKHLDEYVRLMNQANVPIPSRNSAPIHEVDEAEIEITKAWNIYYTVFRSINKQLPSMTRLDLLNCSPLLSKARSLELGIPGSYRVDGSFIKIDRFIPELDIISSKQRPRKIRIRGNDGMEYQFLLKGHEDLRQDERVMQLFGTVNALLVRDPLTRKLGLEIRRYAISPLSHDCGLVGWVPHCDTLHSLIREYRENKKVPLNMETREMNNIMPAAESEFLPIMQKVEIFIEALKRTTGKGNDLAEIFWLKSVNSEEWLERRTNYTRSLAVMSMVGYILGLGDRHPSNLMLDKISGRVLHIDFGDCFEVAMNRDRYPERVPFRLTRILIKAMEVSGIEGSYRSTCERTMSVLRESRDSLVVMLEAFVHDPLISWRLDDRASSLDSSPVDPGTDGYDRQQESGATIEASPTGEINEVGEETSDSITELPGREIQSVRTRMSVRNAAMSVRQAQSVQLHLDIQNSAANLDSRIASITNDGRAPILGSRMERSMRQREIELSRMTERFQIGDEVLNENALRVVKRIQDKLTGLDFPDMDAEALAVEDQVQRLIVQATSTENLAQLFVGWCAFW